VDSIRETLALFEAMGLTLPTPAYLAAVLVFGIIGMVLFWQGRRRRNSKVKWIGLALMLYPYLIWGTVPVYVVGVGLCAAAWWYWRR
jgi:hypothetical protein